MQEHFTPMPATKGFTLIEVIVYLALFSILITGGVMSAYAITGGVEARREAVTVANEAGFVQAKIAWAVENGHPLSSFRFDAASHAIIYESIPLTSSNVVVSSLTITQMGKSHDVSFVMNDELFSDRYYLP